MSESFGCKTITDICYPPLAPAATGAFFSGVYGFASIPAVRSQPIKKEVVVEEVHSEFFRLVSETLAVVDPANQAVSPREAITSVIYKVQLRNGWNRLPILSDPRHGKFVGYLRNGDCIQVLERKSRWVRHDQGGWSQLSYFALKSHTPETTTEEVALNENEAVDPTKVRCVIDLEYMPRDACIFCPKEHALSKENLANMVHFTCGKALDSVLEHEGKVKCPVPECEYHYSTYEIANNVEEDVFDAYMAMINRVKYQRAFEQVVQDLEEKRVDEKEAEESIVVQEAIRNQFRCDYHSNEYGRVFKCPICAFGPIDKMECDDLMAHHEEDKGNGVRISNSCPMCGYYASDVTGWAYWDGKFLQGKRMRETKKIIEKHQNTTGLEKSEPVKQEIEELRLERHKAAASFHPRAKLLDSINPNRYHHYECPRITHEVLYRDIMNNNVTAATARLYAMDTEQAKREYGETGYSAMLLNQLRRTYYVNSYQEREKLEVLERQIRKKKRELQDIVSEVGREITKDLKGLGYEDNLVWGVYEDSEDEDDYS